VPLFTIAEACELLNPPMTERQLHGILRLLGIPPAGTRRTGKPGHPWPEYDWADLARIHAAISPWLTPNDQHAPNGVR
jgi:hypothetical protein